MASLGDIEFQVINDEQIIHSNTVTQKPVEDEADISDHIKADPLELSLKAYFAGPEDEVRDTYESLVNIANKDKELTYSGATGTYERMAISEISVLKNSSYGNGFECDIKLQQIRVAELQEIEIEVGTDPETGEEIQEEADETPTEKDTEDEEEDTDEADPTTLNLLIEKISGSGDSDEEVEEQYEIPSNE